LVVTDTKAFVQATTDMPPEIPLTGYRMLKPV
jgi:hypothetical protein